MAILMVAAHSGASQVFVFCRRIVAQFVIWCVHGRGLGDVDKVDDDVIYPAATPFILVHLACFAAIWTGVTQKALILAIALYIVRMFGITAGYHRYFSHRSFKTSRVFQFALALLASSSAQKGVLWWASKHREHHRHSDTALDVHSPRRFGLFFAHIGWVYATKRGAANYENVKDLTKYPELVWLNRNIYLPAFFLAAACYAVAGWSGLVVGFFWSTVALYHGTFAINSLAHMWGRQRYFTGDDSRNNLLLSIITLGEGWHNNHHYHMSSARQGFAWWEMDPTFWVLVLLERLHIIWDVRRPRAEVLAEDRALPRSLVQKAAHEIAEMAMQSTHPTREKLGHLAQRLVGNPSNLDEVVDAAALKLAID